MSDEQTPEFVKSAVQKYYEEGDVMPLVRLFENRIQLWQYQESRDLIVKMMLTSKVRKKGRPKLSRSKEGDQFRIALRMAELIGAGFPSPDEGEAFGHSGTPASQICASANAYGYGDKTIKAIWKRYEHSDEIQRQIALGRQCADQIRATVARESGES